MHIKILKIRPIVSVILLIIVTFFCKPDFVEGASVVWTEKDIYSQGEIIRVNFTNAPGNYNDWICIVPAGSPDTDGGHLRSFERGNPAVLAIGGLVHTLLGHCAWAGSSKKTVFVIEDGF